MGIAIDSSSTANILGMLPRSTGSFVAAKEAADSTLKGSKSSRPGELNQEQQKALQQLKARDREVRAHEMAHLSAAGGIARSGANFSYQRGPDGQMYAVGGDVSIDTSPVPNDPAATIRKAEQIRRAALAPANPSSQDISVAASAARMLIKAQSDTLSKSAGKAAAYADASNATGSLINVTA